MKMISALARYAALILSLAVTAAQADTLATITDQLAVTDATQLGRLSRNGLPQDWAGTEDFPGVINTATVYHYRTYAVNVGLTPYIQVNVDSNSGNTFVSAYLTSYAPNSAGGPNFGFDTNWKGDGGTSGNYFGTDPIFFDLVAPMSSTLIIVVAETQSGLGLAQPYTIQVEGFTDRLYGLTSSAATTVSLSSSPNPSLPGRPVTLIATVSDPTTPPAGNVRFNDGAAIIAGCGSVALAGSGLTKTAQCVTSFAPGAHNLTATYLGNPRTANPVTSPVYVHTANPLVATTTTLTTSPNPSLLTQKVIVNAYVAGNAPTGTVAFTDSVTATTIPGCGAVPLIGSGNTRSASCYPTGLAQGAHTITGTYSGDATNATSNGAAPQTVNACTGRCGP